MPKEILEMIKAVNEYKKQQEKLRDNITMSEFLEQMNKAAASEEAPKLTPTTATEPAHKFNQQEGSYKVLSVDGTITAVQVSTLDLAQVTKDTITLVWPLTGTCFTTKETNTAAYVSQAVFDELAAFVTR